MPEMKLKLVIIACLALLGYGGFSQETMRKTYDNHFDENIFMEKWRSANAMGKFT